MAEDQQALSLSWVFGASAHIKHSVVNLSDGYTDKICYLAANTAVIYDKRLRKQVFLQGHTSPITCIVTTDDRAHVITADNGPEALLVVWNVRTGLPTRTIQQPHPHGVATMDVAADGAWLATISAADPDSGEQEVALWSMAALLTPSLQPNGQQQQGEAPLRPIVTTLVPAGDVQHSIRFSPNNPQELISNGRRRVYFWSWSPNSPRFQYYSPPLRSRDFKQSVGDFVGSVFVPGTTQALTGTADGDLVVWDEQGIAAQVGTSATDRRAIKLMRIHSSPITLLATIGDFIVSGGEDGYVRFFDPLLRIVAWFEDLAAGPVTAVAFSSVLPDRLAHADAADTLNRFMVPDFVVATRSSRIVSVQSSTFEEYDASRRRGTPILDSLLADVVDLAAHPTRAEFAALGLSGGLQRWDCIAHVLLGERAFEPRHGGACLAYSRDGSMLAVGLGSGHLHVLDGDDLRDVHVMRNTAAGLTRLAVSSTGHHIAAADEQHQLLLYAYLPYKHTMRWEFVGRCRAHHAPIASVVFGESPSGQTRLLTIGADSRVVEYDLASSTLLLYAYLPYKHTMRWEFVGRCRAHHAPIASVVFGESPSGQTRLLTIGADSRVVEYDLASSTVASGLQVASYYDFPSGGGTPTSLTFAPPLQYYRAFAADTHLLVSDDSYKIRVFNPDKPAIEATFLGPTFGGPITQLVMFKSPASEAAFLAYRTAERVVGLIAWPLDGDPSRTMGLIAHPGEVKAISISYDGRKLLTAGSDGTLASWDINTVPLERSAADAAEGGGESRWAAVLGDSELLQEMRDYFVYAQVKTQGEDALDSRAVPGTVPLEVVPDLMRAAGFYPSEADVAQLMAHASYLAHARNLDALPGVSFADLLCLYINHRPLFNVTAGDIAAAFKELGARGDPAKLSRDQLLALLQGAGEPLSADELAAALGALTGRDFLFLELSRSGRVRTRLPGVHLGAGRYAFPAWARVSAGAWSGRVVLWATARPRLLSAGPGFDALLASDYLFLLRDYVWEPKVVVLEVQLSKGSKSSRRNGGSDVSGNGGGSSGGGRGGGGAPPQPLPPLCTAPAKGEWVAPPVGAATCPTGVCQGTLAPLLYGSNDSVAMDFRDVYVPYGCMYRIFTPEEAEDCLSGRRLALVGDSRMVGISWYLSRYQPGVQHSLVPIMPFRVGLRALLPRRGGDQAPDGAGPLPPGGLPQLLSTYDVLILSSELHDIADFEAPAANYTERYGYDAGSPAAKAQLHWRRRQAGAAGNATAAAAAAVDQVSASGGSEACAPGDAAAAERVKYRPVGQYLDALRGFVSYYLEVRQALELTGALRARRVMWLFTGYRPAGTPPCLPNQVERMLCLQHLELGELARAGWEPLDLATPLQDGPPAWFSDDVHVTGSRSSHKRTGSGAAAMEQQLLLNVLCNGPEAA
ncbi:hypothetical protein GPECTOR_1g795 [Gonium pectorale]|uniref:Cilia- and flagella-associated protein 251 n=1 Tax=Gonium pectorale TaxID=33097 RepID=A0A150H492_GONPE|nr:hypothetical protein GPECTOR_1g795 [Gonium pectorale]|eukprot:KXZ56881.1 hypothetical protein GPECTOR_1g795 [Gonium pectorale]